jgi:hypothetical protein
MHGTRSRASSTLNPPLRSSSGHDFQSASNRGVLPHYTNGDAAALLGMEDMHQFGRVFGDIQSRIDFAWYLADLSPLGLAADAPFDMAWNQRDRNWAFPVEAMQAAVQWSAARKPRGGLSQDQSFLPRARGMLPWRKRGWIFNAAATCG